MLEESIGSPGWLEEPSYAQRADSGGPAVPEVVELAVLAGQCPRSICRVLAKKSNKL